MFIPDDMLPSTRWVRANGEPGLRVGVINPVDQSSDGKLRMRDGQPHDRREELERNAQIYFMRALEELAKTKRVLDEIDRIDNNGA